MITIWKYEVEHENTGITVPVGTFPLYVAKQYGKLCVWCRVDTEETEMQNLIILIRGTGRSIPDGVHYLGSFQEEGGIFVFHVFWKVGAV